MPTFLSDPTQGFYLALIAFAVVTGVIFAKRQDKKSALPFGVALLVLLLVFLGDKTGESPREEAVRRAMAMADAANDKNPDAFAEHVAESFEYIGGQTPVKKTRSELKASGFWSMLRQFNVRVTAWDFARSDVKEIDDTSVEIGFMAKGEAEGKPYPVYIRATFKKQGDGAMRLTKFSTFNPVKHQEPLQIPNFP
jgi:hypothetical protein